MKSKGVHVCTLEPGSTQTEFAQVAGEDHHGGASPTFIAQQALKAIFEKQPTFVPGDYIWLRAMFSSIMPRRLTTLLGSKYVKSHTPAHLFD